MIDRIWLIVVETPQISPASAAPRRGAAQLLGQYSCCFIVDL
jgi:hypothetical protein